MLENTQKTILLVEDEFLIAMTEKKQLEQYGYTVKTVTTGEQAVETIETSSGIDLILMDINLGDGIDGTQAAEIILKDYDIPIVFVSSHSEREIVEKTEKITSYGYVVKNSSITVLDASIKMAFKLFDAKIKEKKNELFLNETGEIAKIGGWKIDLETQHLTWTKEVYNLHEVSKDFHPTVENAINFYDNNSKNIIQKAVNDAIEFGIPFNVELAILTAKNNHIDIRALGNIQKDKNGKTVAINGIFQDITEQKIIRKEIINDKNELEKKEMFLQTILSTVDDIIVSRDKHNNVTFFNRAFDQVTQKLFDKPAFIGMNTLDSLPCEEKKYWTDILVLVLKGEKHSKEYMFPSGENQKNFYRTTHVPIINNSEILGSLEITQDITEWKQTEEKLQQSEESFRAIVENTPDYIMRYDQNHKHTYANTITLQANGLTLEEFVGKTHRELGFPENLCLLWEKNIDEVFNLGFSKTIDFEVELNDGIHYLELVLSPEFDKSGNVNSVIGISRDITNRKKTENELAKQKALLSETEKCGKIGGWEFDVETLQQTWTAETFHILEIDSENGEPVVPEGISYIMPEYRDEATKAIQRAIDHGESYDQEWEVVTPKGKLKWVHAVGKSNKVQGKTKTLSGSFQDITEKKINEQKIRLLLSEKELILKEVHHRIKNNMNTISSLLSLQAGTVKEPLAVIALQDAGNRVRSMSLLYDKLYRSADFTQLSVKDYLPTLIDQIITNFPNSQLVKVEQHIDDFLLDAKRLQPLGIIINELLTNIMKYAFIGKTNGQIAVSVMHTEDHITISVQDNGNGIPESISCENSTGFGLHLVQVLTGQLEGTIQIERGNGTKVILEFKL